MTNPPCRRCTYLVEFYLRYPRSRGLLGVSCQLQSLAAQEHAKSNSSGILAYSDRSCNSQQRCRASAWFIGFMDHVRSNFLINLTYPRGRLTATRTRTSSKKGPASNARHINCCSASYIDLALNITHCCGAALLMKFGAVLFALILAIPGQRREKHPLL